MSTTSVWNRAIAAALRAVDEEEELEGEPPRAWLEIANDLGPVENARSAVRATKNGIRDRIEGLKRKPVRLEQRAKP